MAYTLSVVTICFNNLQDVKDTIASVDRQHRKPDEHLIIDGSTNNEIRGFLENNEQPSYRRWICEPDHGISDAFNKGIKHSTGDVIHLLNSGDLYYDDEVIHKVMKVYEEDDTIQWTHGAYKQQMGGQWVITGKPFNRKKLHRGMHKVGHQSMFVKRRLYEKYGLFDLDKTYSMDYDFLIRIRNEKLRYLPFPVVIFTGGGQSNVHWDKAHKEVVDSYVKLKGFDVKIAYGIAHQYFFYYLLQSGPGRALFRWWIKFKGRKA